MLVKDDVVAQGEDSDTVGSTCETNGARVDITEAMVAEGELVPSEQAANAPPTVAVTGQDLSSGAPVLENVTFRNFNLGIRLQITPQGAQLIISLSGEVSVKFSGTVSVLYFSGTLSDLDNWSISVMTREFGLLYGAFVRGEDSPLEDLPIQYADFAIWQRRWLQGEVLERQLAFWRQQLGSESSPRRGPSGCSAAGRLSSCRSTGSRSTPNRRTPPAAGSPSGRGSASKGCFARTW